MTRKISSTLVSALVSGVPVVADDATLAAYTFLKREHVFYMAPGEDEMAVMLRVRGPGGPEGGGVGQGQGVRGRQGQVTRGGAGTRALSVVSTLCYRSA